MWCTAPVDEQPLRYADGPGTEATTHVDAPPGRVWELVADIELPARFSSELQGASWLDGDGPSGPPRAGARFTGRNHHPAIGGWETTCTVVACEPGRVFAWCVGEPDEPSTSWRFELEPEGGGTRLTQRMRMGPAPSGINPAIEAMPDKEDRILRRRLGEHRANMEATLAGVKELAER